MPPQQASRCRRVEAVAAIGEVVDTHSDPARAHEGIEMLIGEKPQIGADLMRQVPAHAATSTVIAGSLSSAQLRQQQQPRGVERPRRENHDDMGGLIYIRCPKHRYN